MCYNAGIVCLNHKKYSPAISYFKEAVRRCNGWPEAAGNLGLALARSGNLDTAEIILGDLFGQHPDLDNCAANYAACAMAQKHYGKAAEAYRKGLDYFPGDTILISGLAQAYKRLRHGNRAP